MTVDLIDFTEESEVKEIIMEKITDREIWYELSKSEKSEIESLQHDLSEQGFGKDDDFQMKACWDEAIRRLRKKWNK